MAGKIQYNGKWMTHEQVRTLKGQSPEVAVEPAVVVPSEAPKAVDESISANSEMESLREAFEAKFGQPVANRYKNDAEWISNKLNS